MTLGLTSNFYFSRFLTAFESVSERPLVVRSNQKSTGGDNHLPLITLASGGAYLFDSCAINAASVHYLTSVHVVSYGVIPILTAGSRAYNTQLLVMVKPFQGLSNHSFVPGFTSEAL